MRAGEVATRPGTVAGDLPVRCGRDGDGFELGWKVEELLAAGELAVGDVCPLSRRSCRSGGETVAEPFNGRRGR